MTNRECQQSTTDEYRQKTSTRQETSTDSMLTVSGDSRDHQQDLQQPTRMINEAGEQREITLRGDSLRSMTCNGRMIRCDRLGVIDTTRAIRRK